MENDYIFSLNQGALTKFSKKQYHVVNELFHTIAPSEIAFNMQRDITTVRTHINKVHCITHTHDLFQLFEYCWKEGWIDVADYKKEE